VSICLEIDLSLNRLYCCNLMSHGNVIYFVVHISRHIQFECKESARRLSLVVSISNPLVYNINDRLVLEESSSSYSDKSHHGHTSIHHLSLLGKTSLHLGHKSVRLGVDSSLVHLSLVGVEEKRIRERQRADGSSNSNQEEVYVSDQDDGTLVGDGVLSRDGSESSPLLKVKRNISIRDKSMSLSVSSSADENPSEHSMTSVPLLSLNGGSPSPLRELRVLSIPVSSSLIEIRRYKLKVKGRLAMGLI